MSATPRAEPAAAAPIGTADDAGECSPSGDEVDVLAAWAAVTDQRRDVLELTLDDVVRVLRGEVTDWAQLGGTPMEIEPYVPTDDAEWIAAALGIERGELAARAAPPASLAGLVAGRPGAFALAAARGAAPRRASACGRRT